ncbi:unnamed protein product [Bursaphelenchus xylophilus]|uniref:(pine wood nematode) hypothetical protein n=1 Tax=Bursaphelenchus xylophilus TaxID=6326 RepID=A0A1I7RKP6_BURXY|nr:unnamed protein product [Bursaphelenchus xylophilus]CAG9131178.1 unnamed protein product [Bursaphelenchus xylophilus]
MYPIYEGVADIQNTDFRETFQESCFEINLLIDKNYEDADLTITVRPIDDDGYEVLVSYIVTINGKPYYVDFDLWKNSDEVLRIPALPVQDLHIKFEIEVHEVLCPNSLSEPGPHRNFRILTKNGEVYVNTSWLLDNVGGSLFSDWFVREGQGESTVVPTNIDENELEVLLKAVCSYSKIIITRQNFDVLLEVAWRFKITNLLRALEGYILQARAFHPMEKLIFAYKYKMAMLATNILAPLDSRERKKDALYAYIEEKDITEIPQELMEMLDL